MRWLTRLWTARRRRVPDTALWVYVRCGHCGEAIRVRGDRRYDLVSEMLEAGEAGPAYTMSKDIVGNRCVQRIAVRLLFDRRLQVIGHEIQGGTLLTAEEYQQASTASS